MYNLLYKCIIVYKYNKNKYLLEIERCTVISQIANVIAIKLICIQCVFNLDNFWFLLVFCNNFFFGDSSMGKKSSKKIIIGITPQSNKFYNFPLFQDEVEF